MTWVRRWSTQKLVKLERVGLNTGKQFYEIQTIKPIKPTKSLNPQQARLASLKRNKDNAKQAYKAERDLQKIVEVKQQIFKATH